MREIESLDAKEVILVAQDLGSYGRDLDEHARLIELVRATAERVARVRLLYLYPSALTDELIETVLATSVPYFDLSLQHVSSPLVRRMRRYGNGDSFLARIERFCRDEPGAAFRSSFIIGYPGETEADHDELLSFLEAAQLDWAGFFAFSEEAGTYAHGLDGKVPPPMQMERLREANALQDGITAHNVPISSAARLRCSSTCRVFALAPGSAGDRRDHHGRASARCRMLLQGGDHRRRGTRSDREHRRRGAAQPAEATAGSGA